MKVDFMIVGTQKGGTTSLDAYLRQHPKICMYEGKEAHFFDMDSKFKGQPDYEKYHAGFHPTPKTKIYGEATPDYMYWPDAIRRIAAYNPKCKLIVMLRDPVELAWSKWNMNSRRNLNPMRALRFWVEYHQFVLELRSFSGALRHEAERIRLPRSLGHDFFSYIDRGRFSFQINEIYRHFPKSQVHFIKSEDFFKAPGEATLKVCKFLKVSAWDFNTGKIHNRGKHHDQPSAEDQQFIIDALKDDVRKTEKLLGWKCKDWLRRPAKG